MERSGSLQVWRWLRTIGGASYSIYLFQFVFIGALWQALCASGLDRRAPTPLLFFGLATCAIAGGVLVSRVVERPLLRFVQGAWKEVRLPFPRFGAASEKVGGP